MAAFKIRQTVDLNSSGPQETKQAHGHVGDKKAHEWEVSVVRGGAAVDLTGYAVMALVNNGVGTVQITGAITGNVASAVFPAACYTEGTHECFMRITNAGDSSEAITAKMHLNVTTGETDTAIDPGADITATLSGLLASEAARVGAEEDRVAAEETRAAFYEGFSSQLDAKANQTDVDDIQAQVDALVVEGDSSVEAAQARVKEDGYAYGTLKARLDANEKFKRDSSDAYAEVYRDVAGDTKTALKIAIGANHKGRAYQSYNTSGVTNGAQTVNGQLSFAIHHYNDQDVAQIDNVGRNNTILTLKQARNSIQSRHSETGRGVYLKLVRDCAAEKPVTTYDNTTDTVVDLQINDTVYDRFSASVYKSLQARTGVDLTTEGYGYTDKWQYLGGYGNEELSALNLVDWKTLGISVVDNDFGVAFTGRWGGKYKGQLMKPLLIYTRGTDANAYGAEALRLYSLAYGGATLRAANVSNSGGPVVHIESNCNTVGKYAYGLRIDHNSDWNAVYINNKGKTSALIQIARTTATFGDAFRITNESNAEIFKISGDGKRINMTDVATGAVKGIQINNGVLEVV